MHNPQDLIWCTRWWDLADYHYEGQDDLPSGIVAVDITAIPEFFKRIKGNGRKYVVISARSDFGLCYQNEHPVAADAIKWIKMQLNPLSQGYNDIYCQARLNKNKCKESDKYSIKCYSFTDSTFDEIPDNVVHWFVANNGALTSALSRGRFSEPKITTIPFGIHGDSIDSESVQKIANFDQSKVNREKLLYINFQFYTNERYEIYNLMKAFAPINKVTCERDVSFDDYLTQLARHKYVFCPLGNGWDCFRSLETMYLGAIPVFQHDKAVEFMEFMSKCIYIGHNGYGILSYIDELEKYYQEGNNISEKAFWPYWENLIKRFGLQLHKQHL